MPALLLPMPFLTALDHEGKPIANARLYLYESESTTNATGYADPELDTPHDQPIVADAAGRFPAIYLEVGDGVDAYRAVLRDADGNALADIDPINRAGGTVGNSDLATGATVTANKCDPDLVYRLLLDHHPVHRDGDTMTGHLVLATAGPLTVPEGLAGFRNITFAAKDEDHLVGLADVGRGLIHPATDTTPRTFTIRPDAQVGWGSGSGFAVYNDSSGAVTVERGVDVILRLAGSTTPVDVVMQQGGFASFFRVADDKWVCAGAGVEAA